MAFLNVLSDSDYAVRCKISLLQRNILSFNTEVMIVGTAECPRDVNSAPCSISNSSRTPIYPSR